MQSFRRRRDQVLEAIAPGVLVVFSTPVALRNNDVEHEYRQDSDLFYLTGFDEPESCLVLTTAADKPRFTLFVRPRDPVRETWDGARAGVDGAKETFGADAAYPIAELAERLPELLIGAPRLFYRLGRSASHDQLLLSALDKARARGRRGPGYPTSIVEPEVVVHEQRLFKTEEELESMRRAIAITGEGHTLAMRSARPGMNEYEIEALLRASFRRAGSERQAYSPIVGSGANATVLHYHQNNRTMQDGDLLLIDAGCELDYYASDITRTFPVNGRFSAEQQAIYEIVLAAQEKSIEATRPGATLEEIHDASVQVITQGLIDLGLIDGPLSEAVEQGRYKPYFMHKTSHWLGMDVHDVGAYFAAGKPRPLEPGMVLTVEPGIYVATNAEERAARYRGIGVRIEDDVLVTNGGRDVLSRDIPKTVADVHAACAR